MGQQKEDGQIGQCFVDLGRVHGYGLMGPQKNEAPGQGGRVAVDLGVHEVAEPHEGAGQRHHHGDAVENPDVGKLPLPGEEPQPEEQPQGGSVAGQSAAANIKQLDPRKTVHEGVQEVLLGLVKEAVAEAGADNGGENAVQKTGVYEPGVEPLATHHPGEKPQAAEQGEGPQNAVPGDFETAERKGDGVDVPLDEKLCHNDLAFVDFLK